MAFYEQQQHGRQQSWDQSSLPAPSSTGPVDNGRWSGRASDAGGSPAPPREDSQAFSTQFEEIERAHENLAKSGRNFGVHNRRDSLPLSGQFARQFSDLDRGSGPSRHQSIGGGSDYDGVRSNSSHSSSTYQGYLAHQRFGPPRQSEAEQMLQFKRRAAAQRERELRNYHQEQQFNRNQPGPMSDRSLSPNAMNEEDRRELIARQHRALYGDASSLYSGDGSSPRPISQDARVLAGNPGGHGEPYDSYGPPAPLSSAEPGASLPASVGQSQPSRENSIASKSPGPNSFAMFDASQQPNRASSSSPGTSPTRQAATASVNSGVAPIGTRPAQPNAGAAKRSTPPITSPLNPGYGFANNDKPVAVPAERATSAASNPAPSSGGEKPAPSLAWGGNGGPWGSNKSPLGTQTSVWG